LICEDEDVYKVNLTQGQTIDISVAFSHATGDLDLQLFNPERTSVASSLSVTNQESITYTVEMTGEHFISVYLFGEAGPQTYDLSASVSP